MKKRILGIDFGDSNIGLAMSDPLQLTSQPLGTYRQADKKRDEKYFKDLAVRYAIGEIVIGIPLRMDGSEGTRVEKTKEFAAWLEMILEIPVHFWDERLTTQQALHILQEQNIKGKAQKKRIDSISATIILGSYLENKRMKSHDSDDR